jgi:hypothetical protein
MSLPEESITERRTRLAGQIARQRSELGQAFRNLEKPIHYAEYGLRGFGFLRQNPWVFTVLPATFSIISTVFSLRKTLKAPKLSPRQAQKIEAEVRPKSLLGHAVKWGGHGVRLFKIYRRIRHYLP